MKYNMELTFMLLRFLDGVRERKRERGRRDGRGVCGCSEGTMYCNIEWWRGEGRYDMNLMSRWKDRDV